MKQITITVPDNCELRQNGSTYTVVEKEKKLTYDDIAKELFEENKLFYIGENGDIESLDKAGDMYDFSNNCTSEKQVKKLFAINKLMNVAKYLNDGWQPDWDYRHEKKYYICIEYEQIVIYHVDAVRSGDVYFKSKELAEKAIEILGEETIKLALCTDY